MTSSTIQTMPCFFGDLADRLEVARLRQDDAEVHQRGFHDQAGRFAAFLDQPLDAPLERAGIVEWHRDRHVDDRLRDASAVWQRGVVLAIADLVVRHADRDHHVVVMAVVRAEDLHDRVPAGEGAGDPDRVHRRFRAGVDIAPIRQAEALGQLVGDDDVVLHRRGEVGAQGDPLLDRLDDGRMGVALDHRAEAVVEVDVLRLVDIPDLRALAVREVDRPGIARLVGRRHAADHVLLGALVVLGRDFGIGVESLLFAVDQLLNFFAVDQIFGRPQWCANHR